MRSLAIYKTNSVLRRDLKVIDVENALIAHIKEGNEEPEHHLEHQFADGLYVRTITMYKGTLMTGKRHRYRTLNIVLSGSLSVYMEDGSEVTRIDAPHMFISEKYIKKLVYMHTDVVFATIHPTEETDVDELEKLFTVSEEEYAEIIRGEL